jgi:hypothetical protein
MLLTDEQLNALLNILTHEQTYVEISAFKLPDAVARYGYPFTDPESEGAPARGPTHANTSSAANGTNGGSSVADSVPPSSADSTPGSPLLQTLLLKLVLPFPGIGDLDASFWNVRIRGLLTKLAEANLSESYDKGAVGTRKTLATAASAVIEAVARGCLGGYPRPRHRSPSTSVAKENAQPNGTTTQNGAHDEPGGGQRVIDESWNELLHGLIRGDLIDDLLDWLSQTDDLEAHSTMVKEATEFAIIQ